MDMCACPTPTWAAAHVLMCLHLSEQGDSRSRFLYDAYRIKRETRWYTPILKTIAILKWKNKENEITSNFLFMLETRRSLILMRDTWRKKMFYIFKILSCSLETYS